MSKLRSRLIPTEDDASASYADTYTHRWRSKNMTRNLQYWVDYWTSLFSGIEHRRFSLSLISPRVLLRELREEIETRGLKNSDNRLFFISQINKYFEADAPTQRCLHSVMTLIRREFQKPRLEVLAQLCRRGLDITWIVLSTSTMPLMRCENC